MGAQDTKLLLFKMDDSKSMEPNDIHPKILKFLSSNESFINAISKLFEKCIEYEMIPYIWKIEILIPLNIKKRFHTFKK